MQVSKTIRIDDALWAQLKLEAAQAGKPLLEYVETILAQRKPSKKGK
jgi:predicted HicB family RNase H-like nuclease